jgi:hypothetical protein
MKIAWILSPLTLGALAAALAVALIACFALYFAVKAEIEIRALRRRFEESESAAAVRLGETELAIGRLRAGMVKAGEQPPVLLPSLNLTRRAQAVRMHQRGEPAATIAAALKAPRNEIELLIRLQDMQQYRAK